MILWGSRLRTSLNWWTTDLFPEPGQPMRPVEESPAAMSPSSSSQFSMCSTPTPSSSSPPSPSSSSSSSSSSTSETSGRRPHSSDNQRERKLQEHRTRARPTPAMSVCLMLLVSWVISVPPGSLVLARRHRDERKLAMWIDENQIKALTGRAGLHVSIPIIDKGIVTPYIESRELSEQIVIPPEVDTVNLTWAAGDKNYSYRFENFTSLDQHLLYQPLLGIPDHGKIPKYPTVFQITIPCKGKEKGVASLLLGLQIFDQWGRELAGTPIKFRLKKNCEAFVTSSLCKQGCQNGGTCNPHGVCECPQGFRGTSCDIALCSPPCKNNGTCISPSTCLCPAAFKGDRCETAVCKRVCENGGQCLSEGYCWCQKGFYGEGCEISRCKPECQNGGTCKDHRCFCSAQYSGKYCEVKDDTERPRRSKEPEAKITIRSKKHRSTTRKRGRKNLDLRLRKIEQRLLKIVVRRASAPNALQPTVEQARLISRLTRKASRESLSVRERRAVVKLLTGMRKNLTSKDKTKLTRFKNLIRKWRKRPKRQKRKKRPKKRRVYVK